MRNYQLEAAVADLELAPKVDIRGKKYTQVATRVEVFRKHFGHDYAIITEPMEAADPLVRVRASILRIGTDEIVVATGMAEENREVGPINKTSALENCETSAVGRVLANFGLHGGEYASAGEVAGAIKQQNNEAKHETKEDFWGGPLPKTAFKKAAMAFGTDLAACGDYDTLLGLLNAPETQTLLTQCQTDMPSWWHGQDGSDVVGLGDRIEERKKNLAELDDMTANMGAG